MRKNLYVHIGGPKTGSTSIQNYLLANERTLRERSVVYPTIRPHVVERAQINGSHLMEALLHSSVTDAKRVWGEYLTVIDESAAETVILSEETIFLSSAELWEELDLSAFDVTVICYVRRPVEYATSLWATAIRYSEQSGHLWPGRERLIGSSLGAAMELEKVNYAANLQNLYAFRELFGKDQVILRPFERAAFRGGSLVEDFLHCCGIDDASGLDGLDQHDHESIGRKTADAIRVLLSVYGRDTDFDRYVDLKNRIETAFSQGDQKVLDSLSDAEIRDYSEFFRSIEHNLGKDFLGRESLFLKDYPSVYGEARPAYGGFSAQEVLNLCHVLSCHDMRGPRSLMQRTLCKLVGLLGLTFSGQTERSS